MGTRGHGDGMNRDAGEMVPFGSSDLERLGIEFEEKPMGDTGDRVRYPKVPPVTAAVVMFKREEGSTGPVWVDDVPVAEIAYDGSDHWSAAWYRISDARRMAKSLGARLVEV